MPASEFAWSSQARMPIFQVYGTKRKAQNVDSKWESNEMQADAQEQEPFNAKRACPWRDNQMCTEETSGMENNNSLVLQPQQLQQLQQQQQTIPQQNDIAWPQQVPPPQHSGIHNYTTTPHHTASFKQQVPGGVMDLCGETFASPSSDTDEAVMMMDSDCVPNPDQYRQVEKQTVRSDFCNEYCGIGNQMTTPPTVRCYCKPSWEGMMTMRPYISDIY